MSKNLECYFTTGEFANICGVKKQTLFHYDEIGLFSPAHTLANGYRYYSYRQLYVFIMIRTLKELNMPLKEIKTYLSTRTPENYLALLHEKLAEVDTAITHLSQIKNRLTTATKHTMLALHTRHAEPILAEEDSEYLLISSPLSSATQKEFSEFTLEYIQFCNNHMLSTHDPLGCLIQFEDIADGLKNCFTCLYSTTLDPTIPSVITKPKGLYAITYHHGSYATTYLTYQKILAFLSKYNLQPGAFFYEDYLIDDLASSQESDFVTRIRIQIKQD
ncbi:MAG: MerR family transcriptional regulator [Cellulosilyticaceae bacterium]